VAADVSAAQRAAGERSPKHVAADDTTRLLWLGDVVPVRPIGKVVSSGDIVLLLGVAAAAAAGMAGGQSGGEPRATGGRHRSVATTGV
jgi:hypothetical protein